VAHSVVFSPDGARVLSGHGGTYRTSYDDTAKLWDAGTGTLIRKFQGHKMQVYSVAFSHDGLRALSGSQDGTLKLWDVGTGALLHTFVGHSGPVTSVAFSPDGAHVLSGSDDMTLRLWDAQAATLLRTFEGHTEPIYSVAFSPDGARVLSGGRDTTVRIWSVQSGEQLASLIGERDDEWLTITPKGYYVTSPNGLQAVTIVRGLSTYPLDRTAPQLRSADMVAAVLQGDPQSSRSRSGLRTTREAKNSFNTKSGYVRGGARMLSQQSG
jgi:WD40 repeat protein